MVLHIKFKMKLNRMARYWGTKETLLPVYQEVDKACEKHPEVDTVRLFDIYTPITGAHRT